MSEGHESYLIGELKAIFFENASNYYKVMLIDIHESNLDYDEDEIVVTGNFGHVREDTAYQFYGYLVNHPKYGIQMKSERYERLQPTTKASLIDFLSGPQFKGIGKVTATHVVDVLGEGAVDKILEDPSCLDGIQGVTKERKASLVETLKEDQGMDRVILALNKYGLDNALAYKIYDHYQEHCLELVTQNPYQLVEDIEQISFAKADAIAEEVGIDPDAPERLRAATYQSLQNHCYQSGDTYMQEDKLLEEAVKLLEKSRPFIIQPEAVKGALEALIRDRVLVKEKDDRYYLMSLYVAEVSIASQLQRLMEDDCDREFDDSDLEEVLAQVEEDQGFDFGLSQREAIKAALSSPVFILTGGPGTGKTTVVNGIVKSFALLHDLPLDPKDYQGESYPILLAAPTGRAAKRMAETTGLLSGTIHRLLGLAADEDKDADQEAEVAQLQGNLLIVDEMSMVDTWLFNQLLLAVPKGMALILVGDRDQLPSVGPGQVYSDLIQSQKLPVKELTEIYRQESDSSIPFLAAQVKEGHLLDDLTQNKSDRSFIPCSSQQVVSVVTQVARRAMDKDIGIEDIQVLAPMYKGPAGIDALNRALQETLNPNADQSRKELKSFDHTYRIGDKVLQLTNEPDLQIFNGDIGIITSISLAKENEDKLDRMTIQFDEIEVDYQRSDFNKITLAYCMSIHKAQGSEFDVVILPYVRSYYHMLKKDLLYTAITRTSQWLILCGEEEAFHYSLQHSSSNRQTSLLDRLSDVSQVRQAFKSLTQPSPVASEEGEEKDTANRSGHLTRPATQAASSSKSASPGEPSSLPTQAVSSASQISSDTQAVSPGKPVKENQEASSNPKQSLSSQDRYVLTAELIQSQAISPMIGMEGHTPYDEAR